MAWHLPTWKIPSYPFFVLGSIETQHKSLPYGSMSVWRREGGKRNMGKERRKSSNCLLICWEKKKILLDVKQSVRLCSKNCLFTWEPEEGMISYLWLFDEHTNCTGKISVFDFMNGEVILRVSLPPGFTSGVSLKNG